MAADVPIDGLDNLASFAAVYHKMDDMALSGSQFEHQFTAAIQSAWAEVESAIIEATLPANPLSPISEGKEAMAVANDELTREPRRHHEGHQRR